jgi:AraC family transcriptional regulator, dual regulator of chb operon
VLIFCMQRRFHIREFLRPGEACHFAEAPIFSSGNEAHTHDFVELFWVISGTGIEATAERDWTLEPGDLIFVPGAQDHRHYATSSAPMIIRNLAFPTRHWTKLRARYGTQLTDPFAATTSLSRRFQLPHALGQLDEMSSELRSGQRDMLVLDRFLLRLDTLLISSGDSHQQHVPAWLKTAIGQMMNDPAFALVDGPAALVRACGRSAEHVARTCRTHLYRSPTQLFDEARCRRAAKLLVETDRSVLDICFDSGFNNVGHFHARFRHWYGHTPRTHRIRVRAIPMPL